MPRTSCSSIGELDREPDRMHRERRSSQTRRYCQNRHIGRRHVELRADGSFTPSIHTMTAGARGQEFRLPDLEFFGLGCTNQSDSAGDRQKPESQSYFSRPSSSYSLRLGAACPDPPMRGTNGHTLAGGRLDPSCRGAPTGKDQRVEIPILDDGELQIAIIGRARNRFPSGAFAHQCRVSGQPNARSLQQTSNINAAGNDRLT